MSITKFNRQTKEYIDCISKAKKRYGCMMMY